MKQKFIVGDLIRYTSLYKEPIAEICEIRETSYLIRYMNGNFARVTNKEIKPIPLTPEILEKNGWDKDNSKFDEYYDNPEYENRYFNWTYNLTLDLDECSVYKGTSGILYCLLSKIKYVHQLQHLLFGLGLNSEMEV